MGEQNDLCARRLGRAQRFQHIAGSAGIGNEQHHILRGHQAGRDQLGGDAGKAGADIICNIHAAALTKAVHLPGLVHQLRSLVHRLRRKTVLGAVDSSHQQGAGVLAQSCRVGIRLRHMLVDQCTGGVGLRQRNAHLMVAVEPQSPAEPEHCRLGHLTLSGQR